VALVVLTHTSVRTAAEQTAKGVRPLAHMFGSLFRLDSPTRHDEQLDPQQPILFDQDANRDLDLRDDHGREPSPKRSTVDVKVNELPGEQLAIDLGPGAARSPWKLPQPTLLPRSESHQIDHRAVEQRGHLLEASLAQHGVETRLVGMVVGPSVTR